MKIDLSNGTAYLALNKFGQSKETLPIDSTVLLLNRLKGPIGFGILQESNAHEWMDTWQEISPVSFEDFEAMLKTSETLTYQDGYYFLSGSSTKDIAYEIDASSYVDFNDDNKIFGIEFLFQGL